MTPIRVDRLLEQAAALGGAGSAAGRPRDADLRRAVSSAYYALFHALSGAIVDWLAPQQSETDRLAIRRAVTHGCLKRVCGWVLNPGGVSPKVHHQVPLAARAASMPDLADLAQTFVDLQERRHEADYDHVAEFSRAETLALVEQAAAAVTTISAVADTAEFEAFAVLVAIDGP